MSYNNQSDKEHLTIFVGPPGPDDLVESVHRFSDERKVSRDDAWTSYIKMFADGFIETDESGLNNFSEMFTDILGQDVTVLEYFLTHFVNTFSRDGQLLTKIKDTSRRDPYTAPAIIFYAKDILDSKGKPINIRLFNEINRDVLQRLMGTLWKVNWIHLSISFEHEKTSRM